MSLRCILPSHRHHFKVSSVLGDVKGKISIHSIQHSLLSTVFHRQGMTVTVDSWYGLQTLNKLEQTTYVFHNWIPGEALSFRLCVLASRIILGIRKMSWKCCSLACWSTVLSNLVMIHESAKLRGVITQGKDVPYWVECFVHNFVPPCHTWGLRRTVAFVYKILCPHELLLSVPTSVLFLSYTLIFSITFFIYFSFTRNPV
jgi:hypothetical protein